MTYATIPNTAPPTTLDGEEDDSFTHQIRLRVEKRKSELNGLLLRFDLDQRAYDLKSFMGESERDRERVAGGWRTHTSSDPQSYANKLIEKIAAGNVIVKIPVSRENEEQRVLNQFKRDWLYAALRMADKRLLAMLRPPVKSQLSYFAPVRGWYAGRVLLRRGANEETIVDITPWDPNTVIWQVGAEGLEWVCTLSYQTYADIRSNHPGVRVVNDIDVNANDRILVYDYYDKQYNVVFAENLEIKQATLHGSPSIPVFLGYAGGRPASAGSYHNPGGFTESDDPFGSSPETTATSTTGDIYANIGESCFQSIRKIILEYNLIMSMMKNIISVSNDRTVLYWSETGTKQLGDNPNKAGGEISLLIGEQVAYLDLPSLARELEVMLSRLEGQYQRATLPFTAYGNVPFELSGYALNNLEDSFEDRVRPFARAAQEAFQQICDKLCEQYATGFFAPIQTPGEYDELPAQLIERADPTEVFLKPKMPHDINARLQAAQLARAPDANGVPLLPDDWIMAEILEIEDIEGLDSLVYAQQGERIVPGAFLLTMIEALTERGEEEKAMELVIEYQTRILKAQAELALTQIQAAQLGVGGGGGAPSGPSGGNPPGNAQLGSQRQPPNPSGVSPSVTPQAELGELPPQPVPPGGGGPASPRRDAGSLGGGVL